MTGSPDCPKAARGTRRLVARPTVGLSGDLHRDLGRSALAVEVSGPLAGDTDLRAMFLAGDPVDFVADIIKESELAAR